jgi:hypothetical protein
VSDSPLQGMRRSARLAKRRLHVGGCVLAPCLKHVVPLHSTFSCRISSNAPRSRWCCTGRESRDWQRLALDRLWTCCHGCCRVTRERVCPWCSVGQTALQAGVIKYGTGTTVSLHTEASTAPQQHVSVRRAATQSSTTGCEHATKAKCRPLFVPLCAAAKRGRPECVLQARDAADDDDAAAACPRPQSPRPFPSSCCQHLGARRGVRVHPSARSSLSA